MSVTAAPRPRIVCVSTYGGHAGGAAVAMQRLTTALAAAGAIVEIVTSRGPEAAAGRRIRRRIRHGRTPLSNTLFSADWPTWDIAAHPAVVAADVIHVHWVAGFLDAAAIRRLAATGKPVVWTQHDMRAFTGGCHYTAGCAGFTADCRGCPQLIPRLAAVPERTLRRSRRLLRGLPLTFVAPSRWLAAELARASLFDPMSHAVHVIPNGIDLARYAPAADKAAARARLGLPAGCRSWGPPWVACRKCCTPAWKAGWLRPTIRPLLPRPCSPWHAIHACSQPRGGPPGTAPSPPSTPGCRPTAIWPSTAACPRPADPGSPLRPPRDCSPRRRRPHLRAARLGLRRFQRAHLSPVRPANEHRPPVRHVGVAVR